eukprot:6327699-Lingulodinium_polyedra.AAC.1
MSAISDVSHVDSPAYDDEGLLDALRKRSVQVLTTEQPASDDAESISSADLALEGSGGDTQAKRARSAGDAPPSDHGAAAAIPAALGPLGIPPQRATAYALPDGSIAALAAQAPAAESPLAPGPPRPAPFRRNNLWARPPVAGPYQRNGEN